ncbi:hypothetical protein F0562_000894 [Nyssa sinensis]|uniref:Uncharacterized protein n=1 Tax=Nyssa sinensis TaxID=561372 RepID=A0A5J5C548_9ASTE|nr:hypothetical protein F0562_000894 [Nyssa sinensis]
MQFGFISTAGHVIQAHRKTILPPPMMLTARVESANVISAVVGVPCLKGLNILSSFIFLIVSAKVRENDGGDEKSCAMVVVRQSQQHRKTLPMAPIHPCRARRED